MLLENRVYGLWVGKQTAKGTPNATPSHRLVQVGGDVPIATDIGSEAWSDLSKFGSQTQWFNSVLAQGTPAIEATPEETAYLLWLFHGAETVTAVTGPPAASRHAFKPTSGGGFWATIVRRIGQSVVRRDQHNDCRIGQIVLEGSTATKAVRLTPTIIGLDPGQVRTSDPAPLIPADKAFLYTDGAGAFTIDGTVFRGQSQFTLTLNEDLAPVYGDDVVAYDLSQGSPGATIAATVVLDSQADQKWNTLVYGSAAPALGAKPLKNVPALGGYAFNLTQKTSAGALNGRGLDFTSSSIQWAIPDYPGPNPAGGPTELALAGTILANPDGVTDPYTIGVNCASTVAAFTV